MPRRLEARQAVGDYEVGITINRNPPSVGENPIEIEIKGPGGRRITEAQVLVNYYMPPMPRMAPMNFTTPAGLKGGPLPGGSISPNCNGRPLDYRPENHPGRKEVHRQVPHQCPLNTTIPKSEYPAWDEEQIKSSEASSTLSPPGRRPPPRQDDELVPDRIIDEAVDRGWDST